MGDEVRRTERGNNNGYCCDDQTNWFDWTLLEKYADVRRFVSLLNARRLLRDTQHEKRRLTLNQIIAGANKSWHGVRLNQPDWSESSRSIAVLIEVRAQNLLTYLMFNSFWEPLEFELPRSSFDGGAIEWRRWIDTALESPQDIVPWTEAIRHSADTYRADARSTVVLFAESKNSLRKDKSG